MKKIWFILIISAINLEQLRAQKEIEYSEQAWFAYLNQTRFTNKSGFWLDVHARFTDDFTGRLGLTIFRPGYIYFLSDQTRLSAGYAYVTADSATDDIPNIPEHRIWQQIQWYDKRKHFNMMQYIRLEERFRKTLEGAELSDEYDFNYRVRYNISFTIPLKGKSVEPKTPFIFVNDEVMINFGDEIVYNYFDQNRFFAGVGYQFTKQLNAQIGYLNVFLQRASSNEFIHADAIRLFVFHNLDFRKGE
jgi:hypothetical protein